MFILTFLGMILYLFVATKFIDYAYDKIKNKIIILALALFPLVIIIQLLVSFGIVK